MDHVILLITYDITALSCEPIEGEAESLEIESCQYLFPTVRHSCPVQCYDNGTIKCCLATYATLATKIECDNLPGFPIDYKYIDVVNCLCDPCV